MALIEKSTYVAPRWLPGGHAQTVYPALFRRLEKFPSRSERIELGDGDFLDLEWSGHAGQRLAVLSHGLEADMHAAYMLGMAASLMRRGWDVLRWNFRGCGGTPNRLLRMYHSGATDDLDAVLCHAIGSHPAQSIDLVGFSLGGNLVLKYLGERRGQLTPRLHRAVAISVPCDLACSSRQLARPANRIYMQRFLTALRAKLFEKRRRFPDQLDLTGIERIRSFQDFDDRFTAPIHGFRDAEDYWQRCSSRQFLNDIEIPALMVNAANDPFLGPGCFPREEAERGGCFQFECPAEGGHVGFPGRGNRGEYWSEKRAVDFLSGT
jgi:predicted alpha/beta-fold hydrolase